MIDQRLFMQVLAEHHRQQKKHGPQNYPFGNGSDALAIIADQVKTLVGLKDDEGTTTWSEVLFEETLEVLAEKDPECLKAELIQVATVALAWASRIEGNPRRRFGSWEGPVINEGSWPSIDAPGE